MRLLRQLRLPLITATIFVCNALTGMSKVRRQTLDPVYTLTDNFQLYKSNFVYVYKAEEQVIAL